MLYNLSPQLFLAKILDFASVGLYSRATSITQVFDKLVVQVLNPIIMPALVSRNKDAAGLRSAYLEAVELLSVVQWPFLLFVAIMAHPIILILLGQNWLEIVPLVRFLCVANLALFAACLSYPILVATGSVRDALTSSLISLPPSLLVILCAAFFGVQAVAASALLTLPFQAAVALYFIGRRLSARAKTPFSRRAEERRRDGHDRFGSDGLRDAHRGEDRTVLRRPDRFVRRRRALLVARTDAHRTSVAASPSSSGRWSGRDCAVA